MKKAILAGLASLTLVSAQAQLFNPDSICGAVWGGLIGGIAGGDCRHGFSGNGAAIGAGVGFLVGSLVNESRSRHYYSSPAVGYSAYNYGEPAVTVGYGYTPYVYSTPNAYCAPGYYYQPTRPNYAVNGTLVGAASGALIGAGSREAGKGAAIGAGAGLLVGTIAEIAAQRRERKMADAQMIQVMPAAAPAGPAPQAVNVPPHNQVTSKPGPTSTYYWTSRPQIADVPQIPDAPRVPDASTF